LVAILEERKSVARPPLWSLPRSGGHGIWQTGLSLFYWLPSAEIGQIKGRQSLWTIVLGYWKVIVVG